MKSYDKDKSMRKRSGVTTCKSMEMYEFTRLHAATAMGEAAGKKHYSDYRGQNREILDPENIVNFSQNSFN